MKNGILIVVDGGNGAGKGTCLAQIDTYLRGRGYDVVLTREPGGTPIGERIRELLLDKSNAAMSSTTELLLFAAARAQHVQEKIVPSLKAGKIVVTDRFASATVSFQHYGRGLSLQLIEQLNDIALGDVKPAMTIVLDVDPAIGLQRVAERGAGLDRMEVENLGFLQRARQGYIAQARQDPEHFKIIDASQSASAVFAEAKETIDRILRMAEY